VSAPRVAIVDYGTGNLFNVRRACHHVGLPAELTTDPESVLAADAIILPGVGAMPHAMRALREGGLADAVRESVGKGTPFLGVCLGMQLLMSHGSEFEEHAGLGLIPGRVVRFPARNSDGAPLKVPHIGWNAVRRNPVVAEPWSNTPLDGLSDGAYMYFVHAYVVVPDDPSVSIATTDHSGVEFCSALRYQNIVGCQFHPERSGRDGLTIYENFARDLLGVSI
jgi:glutamine amidotransferase